MHAPDPHPPLIQKLLASNPYPQNSPQNRLWEDQCKYNIPILIHASLYLRQFCETHQKNRILFTSRDCCHWVKIYHLLFPDADARYFHASRYAYIQGSASYVEYVKSQYNDDTVIVDANGTGASAGLFFAEHLQVTPTYLAIVNCGDAQHGIIRSKSGCYQLEMLNYDTCGLLYDVQNGEPLRFPVEYPLEFVEPMHACIEKCLELLLEYPLPTYDPALLQSCIQAVQSGLAIDELVIHQITLPHQKPVRSFDLFDTLLGRIHYMPDSIFELVERLYPFPGFCFYRMVAACKSDRTLPGIYKQFQLLTDISEADAQKLMQFEWETEKAHIFPIVENRNQVKEGDLIVSDTYYDKVQVGELLDKIGVTSKVQVYASPAGKSSGAAWAFIRNNHVLESHLGDSLYADVAMAKLQNIPAIHYTNGFLSPEEEALAKKGQASLAFLLRTLRLSNPYVSQSPEWLIWNDQCRLNVPILIQSSLYLYELCQKHQKRRVLFTSRDGCLWIKVFQRLFPEIEAIYFHSSRHAYLYSSEDYIAYVRSVYTEDCIVADVQGKGTSCELFFNKHLQTYPTYLAIVNCGDKHQAILRVPEGCEQIEMLNYDTCGTLVDVQDGKPLRREIEYPLECALPMHACIDKCIELMPYYELKTYDPTIVEEAVEAMRSGIALNRYLLHAYWHSEEYHAFIQSIQQVKNCLILS